jgi:FkbH-like protein
VKCLVWDLDGTVWRGTLLESDDCRLRPGVRGVIAELDRRGVLQSVASRNDPDLALPLLRRKGLAGYFVQPQIGWDSKVRSLNAVSEALGVSLDAMALVDDEPFECQQVERLLPGVRSYPAECTDRLLEFPEFSPAVVSDESRARRATYKGMAARESAGREGGMSHSEFLLWCGMELSLRRAESEDLPRILELLARTHQLNATGVVWPEHEISSWLRSDDWRVFVAQLRDRFVDYGRIGVAACRAGPSAWELVVFLLSCRVLSRGIAGYFLAWVRSRAAAEGAQCLAAAYRPGPRNARMRTLYGLSGLSPVEERPGGIQIFSGSTAAASEPPHWLTVHEGSS